MSGIVVGLVLRTPITETFNTNAKFVATVYADHAWEDGTHAYPAVETVANITGLDVRTVQRYLRALEALGMLIPDGKGPHGTNKYKFPLECGQDGSVRLALAGGGTVSPRHSAGGGTESGDTESGDTGVTQTNNPSLVLVVVNADFGKISKAYEQEFGALTPMIADAIKDTCDTYPADWIPEAMQIAVQGNHRSWSYVDGILKNCKAKQIRPSLNRLENKNGNNGKSDSKRTGSKQPKSDLTPADLAAAERINARKQTASV
jgi:DnaD/phage-associated family protein